MKAILKGFSALLAVAILSTGVQAESFLVPQDLNGNIPSDINLVGADVLIATAASAMGSTTPVVLYGYSVSSDAVTNYALLRDSNTPNLTSNIKLTLYPDTYATSGAQTISSKLPVPVIFRNGISINLLTAIVGSGNGAKGRWMFYVRYLRESNVQGKTPAQVDPRLSGENVGAN